MVDRIPPAFLEGLNGGILVAEEAERRENDPAGVYILGEYITDSAMGCYIALYHGSFVQLFRGQARTVWEKELWETIRHEVRHHVEARAGMGDLDREDELELAQMRADAIPRRYRPNRPLRRPLK